MRSVCLLFFVFGFLAQSVSAGPWLREKGKTFTASGFVINYYLESSNTTYVEHGLTQTTTIGVDFGQFRTQESLPEGYATIFMRRALIDNDRPYRLAYELGLGAGWIGETILPHIKTGLSYGRGITFREKSGWLAIDGSIKWDLYNGQHEAKLDSTVGLNFNDKWTGMFQVFVTNEGGETSATLAPSIVLTPKKGRFKIQVGAESPLGDTSNTALKLGLWSEF